MRPFLAVLALMLPNIALAADTKPQPKKDKTATDRAARPCAEYGEGFKQAPGSSTCVKIGGYVRFETGRSR